MTTTTTATNAVSAPRNNRQRLALWIVTLLASLAAMAFLIWTGHGGDQRDLLAWIWPAAILLFAILSGMAYLLWTTPAEARRLPQLLSAALILLVALLARIAVYQTWVPTLSDDLFRYRLEGHLTLRGIEPYSYIPSEAGVRIDPYSGAPIGIIPHQTDLLDRMSNNGELPAVYFPVCQFAFATAAWFEEHFVSALPVDATMPAPTDAQRDAVWLKLAASPPMKPYRIMSIVPDIAVICLLLLILAHLGRSLWWAALYAWHPLSLIEIAGNAHFEALGIMFLLAGLYAALRTRWTIATVLLALALLVKPIALLAFPALLLWYWHAAAPRNWRAGVLSLVQLSLAYALTVIVCIVPFAAGLHDWRITLKLVEAHFEFNGFSFELLRWLVFGGNTTPVRPILNLLILLLLGGIMFAGYRRRWSMPQILGHAFVVYLILTPMVYPWYGLWPLAVLPLCWNRAAWAMSITLLASYAVWLVYRSSGQWQLPVWVLAVEWVPVVILEGAQLYRDVGTRAVQPPPPTALAMPRM